MVCAVRSVSLVGRGFGGRDVQFDDKRWELPSYRSIEIDLSEIGGAAGFI